MAQHYGVATCGSGHAEGGSLQQNRKSAAEVVCKEPEVCSGSLQRSTEGTGSLQRKSATEPEMLAVRNVFKRDSRLNVGAGNEAHRLCHTAC